MRSFEYISVLLSIIISLAVAHLLGGIAPIIENGVKRLTIWYAVIFVPALR
jgi:hypothetical protein